MGRGNQKDLLSRLADAGEDAIQRFSDMPGATRVLDGANALRSRVDELSKRVRGIDELEARIEKLEKQVAALTKPAKPRAAKPPAAKPKPPAD